MRYMIHACPDRMWYVEKYLYPSLRSQGIPEEDIELWLDDKGKGNLFSCMESFLRCGERSGGTWHLQDDVMICSDFAERTRAHDEGIVCGFACHQFERRSRVITPGMVKPLRMWWSFQCIRIPDEIAGECGEWFFAEAVNRRLFQEIIEQGRNDDRIFRAFMLERHGTDSVLNLKPCLVEHVDFLLGGSVINRDRAEHNIRALFWEDESAVDELRKVLKKGAKTVKKVT